MKSLYLTIAQDRPLFLVGCFFLFCFILFLGFSQIDTRQVAGVNTWIKPSKFALSGVIFVWTIAWILSYFEAYPLHQKIISWGIFISFLSELLLIFLQAGRAVPSHYNTSTPFNAVIFGLMGFFVMMITLFSVLLLVEVIVLKKLTLSMDMKWAIALGLLLMLLASWVGTQMIAQTQHTVGAVDGGKGLFYLNWSTVAGDLRIAHFIGVHALQVLPLIVFMLTIWGFSPSFRVAGIFTSAAIILGFMIFVFVQAKMGIPLIVFK